MAWRAVIRTARQPIVIVPPLVFPLFLLAINASGLDAATQIPGFPTDSYLAFVLAFPFMQGAIFATNTAGTNIAQDIGSGFFNRLALTPMRGSSLLAGQLTGVLLVGTIQAIAFLAAGLAAGADIEAGATGRARHVRPVAVDRRRASARSGSSWGSARARGRRYRGSSRSCSFSSSSARRRCRAT